MIQQININGLNSNAMVWGSDNGLLESLAIFMNPIPLDPQTTSLNWNSADTDVYDTQTHYIVWSH